jgi:GTP-binding protein
LFEIADAIERTPEFPLFEEEPAENRVVYEFKKEEPNFAITRDSDGSYVLSGEKIEKLFKMNCSLNRQTPNLIGSHHNFLAIHK